MPFPIEVLVTMLLFTAFAAIYLTLNIQYKLRRKAVYSKKEFRIEAIATGLFASSSFLLAVTILSVTIV